MKVMMVMMTMAVKMLMVMVMSVIMVFKRWLVRESNPIQANALRIFNTIIIIIINDIIISNMIIIIQRIIQWMLTLFAASLPLSFPIFVFFKSPISPQVVHIVAVRFSFSARIYRDKNKTYFYRPTTLSTLQTCSNLYLPNHLTKLFKNWIACCIDQTKLLVDQIILWKDFSLKLYSIYMFPVFT